MLRLALAGVIAFTSFAHAAPPGETPPILASEPEAAEPKSPGTALLLSLGITTAGVLALASTDSEGGAMLGLAGMFIGPSTGRWYAGNASLSGLGVRGLAAGAMLYGFVKVIESECDYEYECDDTTDSGGLLLLAGAGLWIGSSLYDIAMSVSDANKYNARHQLSLAPMRVRTPGGDATGFALTGRF